MKTSKIVPAVNQIETHIFIQQTKMHALLKNFGTFHESWSPLACGKNNIFGNKILSEIAQSHKKTVAQVSLRFLIQQNIPVIPKSTHVERMQENFNIFDFELTDGEISKIQTLDAGKVYLIGGNLDCQ